MENIKCPKCRSEQITANKKGFSGKNAVAGAVLTGGIGLLAGTIGSNKIKITCLNCGNVFNPGDRPVNIVKTIIYQDQDKDNQITETAKLKGKLEAVKFCKSLYGVDLSTANLYVDKLTKGLELPKPTIKQSKGCMIGLISLIAFIGLIALAIILN